MDNKDRKPRIEQKNVRVVKLEPAYYEVCASIDRECGHTFWDAADFRRWKKDDASRHCGWVMLDRNKPFAFMACEADKTSGVITVDNMGVREYARRQGFGSRLMARALNRLNEPEFHTLEMVVRDGHLTCQLFLRSMKVTCVGTAKAYFIDYFQDETRVEDGLCFSRKVERKERDDEKVCVGGAGDAGGGVPSPGR